MHFLHLDFRNKFIINLSFYLSFIYVFVDVGNIKSEYWLKSQKIPHVLSLSMYPVGEHENCTFGFFFRATTGQPYKGGYPGIDPDLGHDPSRPILGREIP